MKHVFLLHLWAIATCNTAPADDPVNLINPSRSALWKALNAEAPDLEIDVYGENPALNQVLLRSGEKTLLFTLATRKLKNLETGKLQKINRVTFRKSKEAHFEWVLWHDGKVELAFKADSGGVNGALVEQSSEVIDKKRARLWDCLRKAFPKGEIEVYAENPSVTEVIFRSPNKGTMGFSLETEKVGKVMHMKALRRVNCITFGKDSGGGNHYVLWLDGGNQLVLYANE
jgi:hypothetical protein